MKHHIIRIHWDCGGDPDVIVWVLPQSRWRRIRQILRTAKRDLGTWRCQRYEHTTFRMKNGRAEFFAGPTNHDDLPRRLRRK